MKYILHSIHRVRHTRTYATAVDLPFLHAVAFAMIGAGLGLFDALGPAPLGRYSMSVLCIAAIVAGGLIILGVQWRGTTYMSNAIERTGHIVGVGVWILDGLIVGLSAGWSFALVTPVVLLLASTARTVKLSKHNKTIAKTVHQLGAGKQ